MRYLAGSLLVAMGTTFSDRITLGSILIGTVLGVIGVINVIAGGRRWRDVYEVEKERREQADELVTDGLQRESELKERLVKLEMMPNLSEILRDGQQRTASVIEAIGTLAIKEDATATHRAEAAVASIERAVREEFSTHEERAQDRHDATIEVLSEIATSLREAS